MITVTITGFKTIKEAKEWATAYREGVEQDMSIWAEVNKKEHKSGYGFPFNTNNIKEEESNITINLTHPDDYIKE